MKKDRLFKWLKKHYDDPIDNLKHWLWRDTPLKNGWRLRVRVPMKNKKYYGFEISIRKEF